MLVGVLEYQGGRENPEATWPPPKKKKKKKATLDVPVLVTLSESATEPVGESVIGPGAGADPGGGWIAMENEVYDMPAPNAHAGSVRRYLNGPRRSRKQGRNRQIPDDGASMSTETRNARCEKFESARTLAYGSPPSRTDHRGNAGTIRTPRSTHTCTIARIRPASTCCSCSWRCRSSR